MEFQPESLWLVEVPNRSVLALKFGKCHLVEGGERGREVFVY